MLLLKTLQLLQENRCLKLRHPVVPTQPVMLVPRTASLAPGPQQGIAPNYRVLVICGDQATLSRRHILGSLKAERAAVGERPDLSPFPGRAVSMRRVFYDQQSVPAADIAQGIHVRRLTGEVHWKDDPGACSYGGFRALRI